MRRCYCGIAVRTTPPPGPKSLRQSASSITEFTDPRINPPTAHLCRFTSLTTGPSWTSCALLCSVAQQGRALQRQGARHPGAFRPPAPTRPCARDPSSEYTTIMTLAGYVGGWVIIAGAGTRWWWWGDYGAVHGSVMRGSQRATKHLKAGTNCPTSLLTYNPVLHTLGYLVRSCLLFPYPLQAPLPQSTEYRRLVKYF